MAIGAIIGAAATIGGAVMSIAGASKADASNKKAIQQQYDQDKATWKFENDQRADVYGYEQQSVAINRQNKENERKFLEAKDRQAYDRQMTERTREYRANKDAYKESEEDYKTQTDLNKKIAGLALKESTNKRNEQRLEQGFANQRNQLSYLKAQDSVNMALRGNKNDLKDARAEKKLTDKRNKNSLQQSQRSANLSIKQAKANKGLARKETKLGKEALQDKKRSALTTKFGNRQALQDQIENADLTRNQNIDNIKDTFGDQKLANKQQRAAINRSRDRELMSSNQNIANIKDTYGDQVLASKQNKANIEDTYGDSQLATEQIKDNLEDTLGDQKLSKDQAVADLDDNEKYQLFEGDNRIADLEGELVTSGLEYQQKRATQAFQQEANNIEALQAQGAAAASGQRGRSAARQVASSMAAAGRANAQLTDDILRGGAQQEDKVSNINRRIEEAGSLQTMQKLTTERRKGNQEDTYQRSVDDRDRAVKQADDKSDRDLADRDRLVGDQTDNLARSFKDRQRLKNQQKSIKKFAKNTAIAEKNDIRDNQRRQRMDKNRQIGDQRESRNLVKRQTKDKMKLENRVFRDSVKSMKTEKKQLMASLDASLSQYGFDIKRSKNSKLAAKQDFKANQQGAKEAYRSAARDYNLTNKQQNTALKRATQQRGIEKSEHKESLKSINKAFNANVKGIALDQYSANITADKNRMTKPIPGPKPPKPIKYPKTIYQDPRAPMTTPKPVKGVAKGGAMLSAVGSGLASIGGIDFKGLGDAFKGN